MIGALVLSIVSILAAADAIGVSGGVSSEGVRSDLVKATTDQALRSIKNADESGADVSGLIDRFNVAIDLQQQAEKNDFTACNSYDACLIQSNDMLLAIVDDASSLRNQATANKEAANVMTFTVYLPVSSFVLSVLLVVMHRLWKSRRVKKFQEMDIHQKKVS